MNIWFKLIQQRFLTNTILLVLLGVVGLQFLQTQSILATGAYCPDGQVTTGKVNSQILIQQVSQIAPNIQELVFNQPGQLNKYWARVTGGPALIPESIYSAEFNIDVAGGNPGFQSYLTGRGICSSVKLQVSSLSLLNSPSTLNSSMHELKFAIFQTITNQFQPITAGMFISLVFGETYLLDPNLEESFEGLGISHVLAVSGGNFALVISAFELIYRRLPARARLLLTGMLGASYCLLIGLANLAALRACLFMLWTQLEKFLGKKLPVISKYLVVLSIILFIQPTAYLSVSLQLSFLASGLLTIAADRFLKQQDFSYLLKSELGVSVLGSSLIFPLTIKYFGQVNLVSILWNLLLVPVVGVINLIALIVSTWLATFSVFPALLGRILDYIILKFSELLHSLSFIELNVLAETNLANFIWAIFITMISAYFYLKCKNYAKFEPAMAFAY